MFKYTASGLRGVRLANGYKEVKTPHGKAVTIVDVEGLHEAIGRRLAAKTKPLSSTEFRFLRKELGFSQKTLAELLGTSEQTLSLWERGRKVPAASERLLRLLYLERANGAVKVRESVQKLAEIDRRIADAELVFQYSPRAHRWKEAVAA